MKYLKKFETHAEYEAYKNSQDYLTPNVSYCVDLNEVHFEKYVPPHDYSKDYLTFVALEDATTFQFTNAGLSYSLDNGNSWTELSASTDTPAINAGDTISFKGKITPISGSGIGKFSSTGKYNAMGNTMSLLFGDDFKNKTDLTGKDNAFYGLFDKSYLVNAKNMVLPATTLTQYCYYHMFFDCTLLTTAPELPATALANSCYKFMFCGCSSLNYIKAMFTTEPATTYTGNWVRNVSPTGTFVKNSAAAWDVTGINGVPSGWTVQTASA